MTQVTHRKRRLGVWFPLFIAVLLLLLAVVSAVAYFQWLYLDRIYPGVTVAGVALGGMTGEEAERAIEDALTPYPGADVNITYGDRRWLFSPADLGVRADAELMAAEAFRLGRGGLAASAGLGYGELLVGLRNDLLQQLDLLRYGATVDTAVAHDEARISGILNRIAAEIDLAPQEATFSLEGLEVSGAPGRMGRRTNVVAAQAALLQRIRSGQSGTVELGTEELRPAVMSVEPAMNKARALLGRSLLLTADTLTGRQQFAIDAAQVRDWVTLTPVTADGAVDLDVQLDRAKIDAYVQELSKRLNQSSFDARLDWDRAASKVIVLEPSKAGQQVDVAAAAAGIESALALDLVRQGQTEISASEQVTLPVTIVRPKIDSDRLTEMGIVELVAEGTSTFKGSPPERVHNIKTAAEKFDGIVVAPGEDFSFNRVVGDVSAANGFGDALVIAGDRTAVGVGGGVCQVSTTAFRAAFWGGFPLVERWAHGYVVGWYGEPGMDASIFTPNVDFRFKNDTGHFIMVESALDTAKGRLTFYIYGTKPNRTVEMRGPEITNRQPAPPPAYQEDPNLPAGKMKQVDWAVAGMDVVVRRVIHYGDGQTREEKIVSKYRPWKAIYLYGPGTQVPGQASASKP